MVFSVCVKATAVSLRAGLLSSYRLTASLAVLLAYLCPGWLVHLDQRLGGTKGLH